VVLSWIEVLVIVTVMFTSTYGYHEIIKYLELEAKHKNKQPDAIPALGKLELYLLLNLLSLSLAIIFLKEPQYVLLFLCFVYYLFSDANTTQLQAIKYDCSESAVNGYRWLFTENYPSLIGYMIALTIIVVAITVLNKVDQKKLIKFFAGGVATFHLGVSSVMYSLDQWHRVKRNSEEKKSIIEKAMSDFANNASYNSDILEYEKKATSLLKFALYGAIIPTLAFVFYYLFLNNVKLFLLFSLVIKGYSL